LANDVKGTARRSTVAALFPTGSRQLASWVTIVDVTVIMVLGIEEVITGVLSRMCSKELLNEVAGAPKILKTTNTLTIARQLAALRCSVTTHEASKMGGNIRVESQSRH
jgi:hypothetical protein